MGRNGSVRNVPLDGMDRFGGSIRGSGAVIIWDEGTLTIKQNSPSHLSFELFGSKLQRAFAFDQDGREEVGSREESRCPRTQ
jgi:hypothetical protein